MRLMDRVIGIWSMIAGGVVFMFAHTLTPYINSLSGVMLYMVAIPTAIFLAVSAGVLVAVGMAQAAGEITIQVERRKLI